MSEHFIFPAISPIIFTIPNVPIVGDLSVRWYGLMYLLAFVMAMFIANKQADRPNSGWTREQVSDFLFYGFLGVVLGGRIGYVLFYQFNHFIENPLYLLQIQSGGMSFHGGFLGVVLVLLIYGRKQNKRFLQMADFVAPIIPLGLGAGRIGNFINAELWGRTTDVPWGVIFPNTDGQPRHPSQLYEFALEGVVLFAILVWFARRPRPVGSIGALFCIGYGSFRFIVEYFREPDSHLNLFFNFISMGQILSLPMIIVGIAVLVWVHKTAPVKESDSQSKGAKA